MKTNLELRAVLKLVLQRLDAEAEPDWPSIRRALGAAASYAARQHRADHALTVLRQVTVTEARAAEYRRSTEAGDGYRDVETMGDVLRYFLTREEREELGIGLPGESAAEGCPATSQRLAEDHASDGRSE